MTTANSAKIAQWAREHRVHPVAVLIPQDGPTLMLSATQLFVFEGEEQPKHYLLEDSIMLWQGKDTDDTVKLVHSVSSSTNGSFQEANEMRVLTSERSEWELFAALVCDPPWSDELERLWEGTKEELWDSIRNWHILRLIGPKVVSFESFPSRQQILIARAVETQCHVGLSTLLQIEDRHSNFGTIYSLWNLIDGICELNIKAGDITWAGEMLSLELFSAGQISHLGELRKRVEKFNCLEHNDTEQYQWHEYIKILRNSGAHRRRLSRKQSIDVHNMFFREHSTGKAIQELIIDEIFEILNSIGCELLCDNTLAAERENLEAEARQEASDLSEWFLGK